MAGDERGGASDKEKEGRRRGRQGKEECSQYRAGDLGAKVRGWQRRERERKSEEIDYDPALALDSLGSGPSSGSDGLGSALSWRGSNGLTRRSRVWLGLETVECEAEVAAARREQGVSAGHAEAVGQPHTMDACGARSGARCNG
eukprot:789418-Rhodomonas_salina.2